MKIYKRKYVDNHDAIKEGRFIVTGEWANGLKAYSRIDEDGNIIPEEEGSYYQILGPFRKMYMLHV